MNGTVLMLAVGFLSCSVGMYPDGYAAGNDGWESSRNTHWSGSQDPLPSPSPIRTVHVSFPTRGSSPS